MTEMPLPVVTPLTEPYWVGLAVGELRHQSCNRCGHGWLPAREECPRCLADDWDWQRASGRGRLISWVVYHQAFHPAFVNRVPYNVAVVELDEGPRMITSILDPGDRLRIEHPVVLEIEDESGVAVPRFRLG